MVWIREWLGKWREVTNPRANLEVKLSGLPEALGVGLGEREKCRVKLNVRPDALH